MSASDPSLDGWPDAQIPPETPLPLLPRTIGRAQPAPPDQRPPRPAGRARRAGGRTHEPQRNRRRLHSRCPRRSGGARALASHLPPLARRLRVHERLQARGSRASSCPSRAAASALAPPPSASLSLKDARCRRELAEGRRRACPRAARRPSTQRCRALVPDPGTCGLDRERHSVRAPVPWCPATAAPETRERMSRQRQQPQRRAARSGPLLRQSLNPVCGCRCLLEVRRP